MVKMEVDGRAKTLIELTEPVFGSRSPRRRAMRRLSAETAETKMARAGATRRR
jgi:hypothetical protein